MEIKTDFILFKANSNKPIIVNEKSNNKLLKRCQDNWYHKLDIKYKPNKRWLVKLVTPVSIDLDTPPLAVI